MSEETKNTKKRYYKPKKKTVSQASESAGIAQKKKAQPTKDADSTHKRTQGEKRQSTAKRNTVPQRQTKNRTSPQREGKTGNKLKVIPLGGLGEVGKNMTLIEYEYEIICIDAGMSFPSSDMPGIDYVIPDFTYLEKNFDKFKGIFNTRSRGSYRRNTVCFEKNECSDIRNEPYDRFCKE